MKHEQDGFSKAVFLIWINHFDTWEFQSEGSFLKGVD
jgi:hypothetical protein